MCSGFATIAGSVLGAYIALGINPQALISSCVMSIPASLALSHLRYPETEEPLTAGQVVVLKDEERKRANGLHALAEGAWLGLKVAGMIVATLLCILGVLGLVNALLTWWGRYLNLHGEYDLTVELVVGYICYPIAFLLGVPRNHELLLVGRLIGIKIVAVSLSRSQRSCNVRNSAKLGIRTSSWHITLSSPSPSTSLCLSGHSSSLRMLFAGSAT